MKEGISEDKAVSLTIRPLPWNSSFRTAPTCYLRRVKSAHSRDRVRADRKLVLYALCVLS